DNDPNEAFTSLLDKYQQALETSIPIIGVAKQGDQTHGKN
ncbi:hypothetical protein BpHYR1_042879, partial [Brachionus plicatilis]